MEISNRFKEIKKILVIGFFALILFALLVNAKQSTQKPASGYDIAVTLVNQEPDPVNPGNFVDVRFKFDNNGSEEARDVEVEIMPEYPFSLYSGDKLRDIGTLQSRQRGDTGVVVKFRIRVDENAVEGENELKLRYKVDKQAWIEPEEFFIDVQTTDAVLAVDSIVSDDSFVPGKSSVLKLKISNLADSLLRDIRVRLDLGGIPLVPKDSTNERTLYQLDSKQSYDIQFNLVAEPDAESSIYKVPLELEYFDELGKRYFKNQTIGLTIGAKPDLSVTLDETEIYEAGKPGEIDIKVVNKGVTDLKFMNIKLMPSNDYRILSSNEIYLGNIDSDDFETAVFMIFAEKTSSKAIKIPIILEYKDANNNDFKEEIEMSLSLYTATEAKKFGLKEGNHTAGIIIVIVIVVSGLYAYRKYWKKKKK